MDKKKYNRALLIFISYCLVNMELPFTNKSILTIIVPPITYGNSTFYPASIVSIVVILWVFFQIKDSKRFTVGTFTLFIMCFVILLPFSIKTIDIIKSPIYFLNNGVSSIEIKESELSLSKNENLEYIIIVSMQLKGYRNLHEGFKIQVELNDELLSNIESVGVTDDETYYIGYGQETEIIVHLPVDFIKNDFKSDYWHLFNSSVYYITFFDNEGKRTHWRNDAY